MCRRHHSARCWQQAVLWIVFCAFSSASWSNPGVDWLESQRQASGEYAAVTDLTLPITGSFTVGWVYQALQLPTGSETLAWLDAETIAQPLTEFVAQQVLLHPTDGVRNTALIEVLLERMNDDGGFGDLQGYGSSVVDTAWVLEAFATAGEAPADVVASALGYLLDQQQADGGWQYDEVNETEVMVTAIVMRAIWRYREQFDVASALGDAENFLLAQQQADNSWGEQFESAWALLTLLPYSEDASHLDASVEALRQEQLADGSWMGDVY
ncbi:MAG: prenyltransferase/squalene oxidase repeat-containing protein, partial [Myxococcota bacterium]